MVISSLFGQDDTPRPQTASLSPETQELIGASYDRALQDPNQMGGVDQAAKMATPEQALDRERRIGGLLDENLTKAIRSKHSKTLGDTLGRLKTQAAGDVFKKRAQRLKFAQEGLMAQQQVENQNYQRLIDAHNNEQSMRAQLLQQWMGIGGMAAGMALGGPPGAAVGGQMGASLGPQASQPKQLGVSEPVSYGKQNMGSRYGGMTEPLGDY